MKNNFENYFSETDFDFQEPESGHFERFESKLKSSKKKGCNFLEMAFSSSINISNDWFWTWKNATKIYY